MVHSVATFNIWAGSPLGRSLLYAKERRKRIVDACRESDTDLLLLQEIWQPELAALMAKELRSTYRFFYDPDGSYSAAGIAAAWAPLILLPGLIVALGVAVGGSVVGGVVGGVGALVLLVFTWCRTVAWDYCTGSLRGGVVTLIATRNLRPTPNDWGTPDPIIYDGVDFELGGAGAMSFDRLRYRGALFVDASAALPENCPYARSVNVHMPLVHPTTRAGAKCWLAALEILRAMVAKEHPDVVAGDFNVDFDARRPPCWDWLLTQIGMPLPHYAASASGETTTWDPTNPIAASSSFPTTRKRLDYIFVQAPLDYGTQPHWGHCTLHDGLSVRGLSDHYGVIRRWSKGTPTPALRLI